jgi:peptide/nickel transport system substrate-binding protein
MAEFCDPAIDVQMEAALQVTDKDEAARLWAAIDRKLTDLAPAATLFQFNQLDLVSRRVGHFRFSTLYHMLFSEAWVQ